MIYDNITEAIDELKEIDPSRWRENLGSDFERKNGRLGTREIIRPRVQLVDKHIQC